MVERGRPHLVEVDGEGLRWVKSSASGNGTQACVEVAARGNDVLVRSSRSRTGPRLSCSVREWAGFLDWLRLTG